MINHTPRRPGVDVSAYDTEPLVPAVRPPRLVSMPQQRPPVVTPLPTPAGLLSELFMRVTEYYIAHNASMPADMRALLLDMQQAAHDAWSDQVSVLATATQLIAVSPAITDALVLDVVRRANYALRTLA